MKQFDELGELHAIFNSMDGHAALSKAEQLMIGLGFSQEDLKKTVKRFLRRLESSFKSCQNFNAAFRFIAA